MKISAYLAPLPGLLALGLSSQSLAATNPDRTVGPQPDGTIVVSSNQLLRPSGKLVPLGSPVRAKAVAVNPNLATNTAAVLLMSAAEPIIVFNTKTGAVLQRFVPTILSGGTATNNTAGSFTGLTYSADGSQLLFSQDNNFVAVASVNPTTGLLLPAFSVPLPSPPPNPYLYNSSSSNAGGLAVTADKSTALVALNADNTVGVINLASGALTTQIPVGNAPNRIVISGNFAYVTNEGGRPATANDFTNFSDGTQIVVDPTDAFATTGTVSVIDLTQNAVVATINVGLHPAGMALSGTLLYVVNSYSDSISVIDTTTNTVVNTIPVGVPVTGGAFGAGANGIVIVGSTAYVTLGESNAIAVVNLTPGSVGVQGYIPTAYFPTTIDYDAANNQLVVSDDKGIGAQGSIGSAHGVDGFNTHQDTGVVNLIPLSTVASQLSNMTNQVIRNNDWNSNNTKVGPQYVNKRATPVALPKHIGEPSLINHVFLFIKENRTYDQILGDLPQGNGDPNLAVFAANTPNQHAIVQRFPLLDNVYAPSRQSADGHPWIVESGSFYSNDILSPDWIRSYPGGNSNDALTYTPQGFLWSAATRAGLTSKLYGEWSLLHSNGGYSWAQYYETHLYNTTGGAQGAALVPPNTDTEFAQIPSTAAILDPHYPSFDLTIPDQYRADYWISAFQKQVATGSVPNLTIIWLPDDHTNGTGASFPLPANYQADNDLALGRMVQAISSSPYWGSSAIFVEEDDSQDGVDHVDGHRQPVYVLSPYTVPPQAPGVGRVIHTTYTQENINRTIENILGLQPLTQFDLVASPMFDVFQNTPNLTPFTAVPATTPLNVGSQGVIAGTGPINYTQNQHKMSPLEKAWELASAQMTKGKEAKPDAVDEDFLNHVTWYSATNWKRPYPGESKILPPDGFVKAAAHTAHDSDD